VVFGCGTVGSNVAVECAKLGVGNFSLYDFDVIEGHNVPSQRYNKEDIGRPKVEALAEQLEHVHNAPYVKQCNAKVEGPVLESGIMLLAVDSMSSRRLIFEKVIAKSRNSTLMLDMRMSGNLLQCYAIDPRDGEQRDNYLASLFDDKDADPAPCGGRTVSYTGALSGAIAANFVRKHLDGKHVQYFTAIDLEAMAMTEPVS
jgi:molybdopterin/thiamine biosynthesis adenylyltransferase